MYKDFKIIVKIILLIFFLIFNFFLKILLKVKLFFDKKLCLEIFGVSRSGSTLLQYLISRKLNSLVVGEIHYKYFDDNNIKYEKKYVKYFLSLKSKKFYKSIKLPRKNFINFLLDKTKNNYLLSNSKNINYINIKHNYNKVNNLNIIIIKKPILQLKSYVNNRNFIDNLSKNLENIFNQYYKILKYSFIHKSPFIVIRYEDLFNEEKKNIIFRKLSEFVVLKKNEYKNSCYYPFIGSKSFKKSRLIKEDKKRNITFSSKKTNLIINDLRAKGLNLIRNF